MYTFGGTPTIRVRNLREGEASTLPPALQDTGMAFLIPEWTWVVECDSYPAPFAIVVAGQGHSWLVLFRLLALSPLPPGVPLTWFMEAHPQVFAEARRRGCVGFLALLGDDRPEEAQMARIAVKLAGGTVLPGKWSMCAGPLAERKEGRG